MVISGVMKLIGSGMEFFLVIPGIGGTFILSLLWIPLLFMLVYHIVTLVLSRNSNQKIWGPVVGIVASTIGIIPLLGMLLHWAAFICLLIDGILTLSRGPKDSPETTKVV
ncbi:MULTISPECIES: hypothetical protein [Allobacillus]|uniref:Uncharacterized protein n=1 Tax=Allobacillus halotolerans TaxID=570278 RepID=A0ABS6GPB1_9BACI|nr:MULTISPECIES: hypothetical protein [Allobacillus]MBU6080955.1 hypothetical protein [Allobacillus halotolerans]TSJ67345.1 hypothetical protein FPQ10_05990 [Allobacillus sp. SKP2-8]